MQSRQPGPNSPRQLAAFLDDVSVWADARADVAGLALIGSHARGAARPDSDVDLIVLCEHPETLADNGDWVAQFGELRQIVREKYGMLRALRVFYEDGLEVEFGVTPLKWVEIPLDAGTQRVISDGMRILHDPAGLLRGAAIAAGL